MDPMTAGRQSISAVIPVYNSVGTIRPLIERLTAVLTTATDAFEIILVDDGSADDSWAAIEHAASTWRAVRGIRLMRNYGQHNALLAGIRAAHSAVIVTLDDDLQNPPEEIPKLLARLDDGFDVVYGDHEARQSGLWRNATARFARWILRRAMSEDIASHVSQFRAFRTPLRDGFSGYHGPFVSVDVLLSWSTTNFAAVAVRQDSRHAGTSQYTVTKLLGHAIDMLTGFSTVPLRIASLVGFAFTLFGFGALAWVLGRYLIIGYSVPGFPFLASALAIFSGAQLFAIGVIGEYLARLHLRAMGKPDSVIRTRVGFDSDAGGLQ